jgi:hypothetical protein
MKVAHAAAIVAVAVCAMVIILMLIEPCIIANDTARGVKLFFGRGCA